MMSIQREDDDESSCEVLNVARRPLQQQDDDDSVDSTLPPRITFPRRRSYDSLLTSNSEAHRRHMRQGSHWSDGIDTWGDDEKKQPASDVVASPSTPTLQSATITPKTIRPVTLNQKCRAQREKGVAGSPKKLPFSDEGDDVIVWAAPTVEMIGNISSPNVGTHPSRDHEAVMVTPEFVRGKSVLGTFGRSEGNSRKLVFDVDDNPLQSPGTQMSRKDESQPELDAIQPTCNHSEIDNGSPTPKTNGNENAIARQRETRKPSSSKKVHQGLVSSKKKRPRSDFERLFPFFVDVIQPDTTNRRAGPRETDLAELGSKMALNNSQDHAGSRQREIRKPSSPKEVQQYSASSNKTRPHSDFEHFRGSPVGTHPSRDQEVIMVTPELVRGKSVLGAFGRSEGIPRKLIFDVDDNPLQSLGTQMSRKDESQQELDGIQPTRNHSEIDNGSPNLKATVNENAIARQRETRKPSSSKKVHQGLVSSKKKRPRSDFERLFPFFVDVIQPDTTNRRARPRGTDLAELRSKMAHNNSQDHARSRQREIRKPSSPKEVQQYSASSNKTRPHSDFERLYPEFVDDFQPEAANRRAYPMETGLAELGSKTSHNNSQDHSRSRPSDDGIKEDDPELLRVAKGYGTPAEPVVIDLIESEEESTEAAPNLNTNLTIRRKSQVSIVHEPAQPDRLGKSESDSNLSLRDSSMKLPNSERSSHSLEQSNSGHDSDSAVSVGIPVYAGLLRKRQAHQLEKLPEKRVRKRSKRQEEVKRLRQAAMQQRGYYAKREVCVLVPPDLGPRLMKILDRFHDCEKTALFPIVEYNSGSELRVVQFARCKFLDGGAQAAEAALEKGDMSKLDVSKQVIFPFDCLNDFLVLLTTENADDDCFPKLREWLTALKCRWQRQWNHVEEPQISILIRSYGDRSDKEQELMDRAKSFLGVIHGVECISCGNPSTFLSFLQHMAVSISKAAYAKPTTNIECRPRFRAAENLESNIDIAHDTWFRMLRSIPCMSADRASTLLQYFPTMRSLWLAYQDENKTEKEKELLVADLLSPEKHLVKLSTHICRIMTSSDPNEWIH